MKCQTVAFIIFNRPEATKRVFERIAAARPRRLLVIADHARPDRAGEAERCRQARAVVERVDWPCEVHRNFADRNLGCRERIVSGLDWVFENSDDAIIIEDDCLPDPTFFSFAAELLEQYRCDERVMGISGDNFQPQPPRSGYSYYFSRYFHCWGWATWRRAWQKYDHQMKAWPALANTDWLLTQCEGDPLLVQFWRERFAEVYDGRIDTWDYQFVFACWVSGGMTILPRRNLVSNLGFGADATHTTDAGDMLAALPTEPMAFPLRHAPMERDRSADRWWAQQLTETVRRRDRRVGWWKKIGRILAGRGQGSSRAA